MTSLDGKTALVTGAASGIGRAIAAVFADAGAAVAAVDRNVAGAEATVASLRERSARAELIPGDVTRALDCQGAVERTVAAFGRLDILVNAAGIIVRRSVTELDETDWDRVMNANVRSVFLLSKFTIPVMAAAGGGAIVNVGSGWGLVGGPRAAAYCASKGAVVLLTKAMAIDCGPLGIRVNCLCPGDTDSPMLREEARQLGVEERAFASEAARRPLGRVGTPEEVARAALFLASDEASFVTGTTLVVDGGGLAGG